MATNRTNVASNGTSTLFKLKNSYQFIFQSNKLKLKQKIIIINMNIVIINILILRMRSSWKVIPMKTSPNKNYGQSVNSLPIFSLLSL